MPVRVEIILSPEVRTRALQALVDQRRIQAGTAEYRAWTGPDFKAAESYGIEGGAFIVKDNGSEYFYPSHAWERVKVSEVKKAAK